MNKSKKYKYIYIKIRDIWFSKGTLGSSHPPKKNMTIVIEVEPLIQ
jgi:hypothetical protein